MYYYPDTVEFPGGDSKDSDKFVAIFFVSEPVGGIGVAIDTATGNTIQAPGPDFDYYTGCISYINAGTNLREFLDCTAASVVTKTIAGTQITVENGVATFQVPATSGGGGSEPVGGPSETGTSIWG